MTLNRNAPLLPALVVAAAAALLLSGPARGGTDDKPRTPYRPSCCAISDLLTSWGCLADPRLQAGEPVKRTACAVLYGLAQSFCDISSCER